MMLMRTEQNVDGKEQQCVWVSSMALSVYFGSMLSGQGPLKFYLFMQPALFILV